MLRKILFFLLFLPVFAQIFQLFFLHYDGNYSSRTFSHGFDPSYSQGVSGLDFEPLDGIFSKPFYFLGQGKQMIAFVSADDRYVLKFFNPMRPLKKKWYMQWKFWKRYTSLKWISREWLGKKERLKKLFFRHKLAFELLNDETGLVFVHLRPSKRICHLITVTDPKDGRETIISLENTPFVLQKKADLASSYLNQLLAQNRIEEAKKAALQMEKLLEKRAQIGITDRIQTMENNYGFVDGKPIQIDVGRILYEPQLNWETEKNRIINNFQIWMNKEYGHLLY